MSDMQVSPAPDGNETPPSLRFLKALVTTLAGTMIAGLITIIALLVIRFPTTTGARPTLPDQIALPAGAQAEALTMGRDWYAVVTDQDQILIFDTATGSLRQTVDILPATE